MSLQPKKRTLYREVWRRLKANGYDVIPLREGKGFPFKDWPNTPNSDADIATWSGRSAAIRMYGNDVFVIDLDVLDEQTRDAIVAMLEQRWPQFMATCLRRHSGKASLALIGRANTATKFGATMRHTAGDVNDPKAMSHRVEFFTGANKRYVAVHGMHSPGRDYDYVGRSILDTNLLELPWFPEGDIGAMARACEEAMQQIGLQPIVPKIVPDSAHGKKVYDLEPEMMFRREDGSEVTLAELEKEAGVGTIKGYASIWDPASTTPNRVLVNMSATGLALWDTKTDLSHRWADREPQPDLLAGQLRELQADLQRPARNRPDDAAPLAEKALWLLDSYGYCALGDTVVELHKAAEDCQLKPLAFQRLYRSWREEETGPQGGRRMIYAASAWEVNAQRIDLEGVRLRPDQPFPIYDENGRTYKNTYLRPRHEGAGKIQPWRDFMAHLLPVAAEREWFCNWLAHKPRHPGVPGVAVVMVAANADGPVYGAGRGMLRDIIARLLGPTYVRSIDFDVFTGKSAQGVYTDWGAHAVMVTVSEARDTGESGRWSERRAVYERLKEIVDPRAIERTFLKKHGQAFQALAFAAYLIFSNNRDALQIPAGDRRVAALSNGERMTAEMAEMLQAWMMEPGNIAALARWLEARNLTGFDVYTPPMTQTKLTMQELARSDTDDAWDAVRKTIGSNGLFTGKQLLSAVLEELQDHTGDEVKRMVNRRIRAEAARYYDYRMPPLQGRDWILQWRGAHLTEVGVAEAQVRVVDSSKRLAARHPPGSGAVILPFEGPP